MPGEYEQAKIRLRGKGSGYKEGHNQKESSDPLHLCLSTCNYDQYKYACQLVETLLTEIYEEYSHFLRKQGKKVVQLKVSKQENVPASMIMYGYGPEDEYVN